MMASHSVTRLPHGSVLAQRPDLVDRLREAGGDPVQGQPMRIAERHSVIDPRARAAFLILMVRLSRIGSLHATDQQQS